MLDALNSMNNSIAHATVTIIKDWTRSPRMNNSIAHADVATSEAMLLTMMLVKTGQSRRAAYTLFRLHPWEE